ncbi:MAG: thioredoxin family protein [Nitrospirales bacterium]|nr:thioredoxin family protein [Nitrospira sp.]MDR4503036.1 thioredoxin family protein [Nitrospirales bacterium]
MALTNSTMLPLGTPLPPFQLPDVKSGQRVSQEIFSDSQGVLVMFICKHCPFVVHVEDELARIGRDYRNRGLGIIAISSNDVSKYPDDAPHSLKTMAESLGFVFPMCYDENQAVAKTFTAACTPDFFLFDNKHTLVYRGQLDDSRPGNGKPVTGKDLRAAVELVLAGKSVPQDQRPSAGCNIKWKSGNEPDYF